MDADETTNEVRDAEVSLLGAALIGADITTLAELVEPGDFYDPRYGQAWAAIVQLHQAGTSPDVVTLRTALADSGTRIEPLEVFRWTELTPGPAAADHYARRVAEAAGFRALVTAGSQVALMGRAGGDLNARREDARQTIDDACRGRHIGRARSIADILPNVIETAQHGKAAMLSTPWPDLDYFIGGLAPGRFVTVGARPGVGKSLMLTNLALHMARRHGHAVLFASMEMDEEEVGQRLLAAHASVNLTGLMNGTTDQSAWDRIDKRTSEILEMPIFIEDAAGQTVTSIRAKARDIQRARDDLALICVDYLQLMGTRDSGNRAQDLGEVSRGLKLLARETGACVVAAAQLNRTAVANGRPRSSDLRESGSIEADSDQVILLHQPDDDISEVDVIVDKNRHGPKGQRVLQVWGHYARLESPTRHLESVQ